MKLTEAMRRGLALLASGEWGANNIRFTVGEALRKRGLAERYTTYVVGADFADKDGVHVQYRQDDSLARHEWWITPAGRAVLDGGEG
jgi:hypothetical protein